MIIKCKMMSIHLDYSFSFTGWVWDANINVSLLLAAVLLDHQGYGSLILTICVTTDRKLSQGKRFSKFNRYIYIIYLPDKALMKLFTRKCWITLIFIWFPFKGIKALANSMLSISSRIFTTLAWSVDQLERHFSWLIYVYKFT